MRLQDSLNLRKANFESSAPAADIKVMHSATDSLINSDLTERALKKGDQAPLFSLPAQDGTKVALKDLMGKGPVVIQFYRGGW